MKIDFELKDQLSPYETFVLDFWSSRRDTDSTVQNLQSLFVMGLGLPGENAEVLEQVYNHLTNEEQYDEHELHLELGDVYYYLTRIAIKKGITEAEISNVLEQYRMPREEASFSQMEQIGYSDEQIRMRALVKATHLSVEVGKLTELLKKEVRDTKLDHAVFKDTFIGVHQAFHDVLKHYELSLETIKDMNHNKLLDRQANGKAVKKVKLKFG